MNLVDLTTDDPSRNRYSHPEYRVPNNAIGFSIDGGLRTNRHETYCLLCQQTVPEGHFLVSHDIRELYYCECCEEPNTYFRRRHVSQDWICNDCNQDIHHYNGTP